LGVLYWTLCSREGESDREAQSASLLDLENITCPGNDKLLISLQTHPGFLLLKR